MSKFIREDSTIFNVQRQQSGIKKSEDLPQPNKVGNLVNQGNDFAPPVKPYPLDRFDDISTDVFVGLLNLRKIIETAKNNPSIKNKNNEKLNIINRHLENMGKNMVELSKIVDTIN
jgi:hypothetical protein